MDQLKKLKDIIFITESIIEDQKLIKEIAENLHHETKQSESKQEELKDILSQTQKQIRTKTHIPIAKLNILAKEVNDKKAEQKKKWHSLQRLLNHVHIKTNHQINFCNENKGTVTIDKNAHNDNKLTNGVNSSDTSLHYNSDYSSISGNDIPQKNIKVDTCPLRFDTLVDYFETRESNGQQAGNNHRFINGKISKLYKLKNMKFSSKTLKLFQKP